MLLDEIEKIYPTLEKILRLLFLVVSGIMYFWFRARNRHDAFLKQKIDDHLEKIEALQQEMKSHRTEMAWLFSKMLELWEVIKKYEKKKKRATKNNKDS